MKEYKKPAMLALSISANDMLCSCSSNGATKTVLTDPMLAALGSDYDGNGKIDKADYDMMFASAQDSCSPPFLEGYEDYCKFTGTSELSTVIIYS